MAVKALTLGVPTSQNVDLATWAALTQTGLDSGAPVNVEGARALTAYLKSGTLGAAGAVLWEGSDDGVTFFPMFSDIGIPAAISQVALLVANMLKERPRFVRPRCTAGDGTTSLIPVLVITR
jgi:hypothetical protein